jgi:pimeloyl-ACP methyl ester carboxylesterase
VPPDVAPGGARRSDRDAGLDGDLAGVGFHGDLRGLACVRQADLDPLAAGHDSPAHWKHDPGTHSAAGPRSAPPGYAWAMARDRRREHLAEQVIWITPGWPPPRTAPSAAVAGELAGRAVITQIGLTVWDIAPGEPYDLAVEVNAVNTAAQVRGLSRYHLFGFSAGATVALAATLALGDAVQSLTLLEAAVIGDDDWHPAETAFRARLAGVRALPAEQRIPASRQLYMRPGEPLPPLGPPAPWDARDDMLEDMLAQVGFTSSDLAAITVPVLAISGGCSNPRFQLQDERLVEVIPHARAEVFSERSHSSPPHRAEPARLADMLIDFWTRSARTTAT